MKGRFEKATGIVVRRHVLPNTDLILTLFCPEGKLKLIARAGANTRSKTVAKLNLFQNLSVQYISRHGDDLGLLTQTALEGALPRLSEPQLYPYANLLCELADSLFLEGQEAHAPYALLAASLRGLCIHPDPEWVTLVLSFKLLGTSGLAPRLTYLESEGLPRFFDPNTGSLEQNRGVALSTEVSLFLTEVFERTVRELMDFPLEGEDRALLWRLLERYFTLHVKELKSWFSLEGAFEGKRSSVEEGLVMNNEL